MILGNDLVLLARAEGGWWLFQDPVETHMATDAGDVQALLDAADLWTREGGYAAGWLSYEAAPAFDAALETCPPGAWPVAWFGLYNAPSVLSTLPDNEEAFVLGTMTPSCPRSEYHDTLQRVRDYLRAGDTYQVNFSLRLRGAFEGDPFACFRQLYAAQPSTEAAFIQTADRAVVSLSPELFLDLKDGHLISRPMKGTRRRGRWRAEDAAAQAALAVSPKDRSENVMIVDMIRNDMGRVADPGSVVADPLYVIERYPTVWQMTSTVVARTAKRWTRVLSALFPCASITGAPKVRTMQLIRQLEGQPRGIYTGAIGWAGPDNRCRFSVAIRTLAIDRSQGHAEYGAGGGIVWESDSDHEYDECLDKARVLSARSHPFGLLETLRWEPGSGYALLDEHMARLIDSAHYFGRSIDEARVRDELANAVSGVEPMRVRLVVNDDGAITISSTALPGRTAPVRLALATHPVDAEDVFLYHKTTRRDAYEDALATHPDHDDVLLHNTRGEVTESCLANVVIVRNGQHITPPRSCGLLAGTYRQHLIETGALKTGVIHVAELRDVDDLYLINSVRGAMQVELSLATCQAP